MISLSVRAAVVVTAACLSMRPAYAAENSASSPGGPYRRDNLIAWCIVPFDAKKRGPEERAAMLEKLGFKHFAYDYRTEHVPTFDAEIEACKRHGVSLDAWWFPGSLNEQARQILSICKKHDIRPQLWVSGGGTATANEAEQRARVKQEADRIRPIAEAAAAQEMKVGLYNHGGWYGEPENQLEIIAALGMPNVGIVYNFHHGHDHLERFAMLLPKMLPHLLTINLNGMVPQGDRQGQKILQLGQGTLELELLRTIRASGYAGPIGILGHTQDDAEARLADNLDGLDWLLPQLDGKPTGPKPVTRTPVPGRKEAGAGVASAPKTGGWAIAGRNEYRTPPLTVTIGGTLTGSAGYNILAACDTKASGAHWEVFTMPKSGLLTAYLPGSEPDHVRSNVNLVDGKPHAVTMTYGTDRVRLFVDGKLAADQAIRSRGRSTVAGDLAIGRLVEGGFGCDGRIDSLRLMRGASDPVSESATGKSATAASEGLLGLWTLGVDAPELKNPAKRGPVTAEAPRSKAPIPPAGVHLKPVDARLKATLVDRSADEVYMGVKVDAAGNVFVGGRRKVFVFPRQADGSLGKRHELLTFPPDSIIMGLEFRGDDLYVLTDNALYLVPGGRVARENLRPERILWGLPLDLHVSFHCLTWGPDGDLYLTHGDPLLGYGNWERPDHWGHWTLFCGRENTPLPYTGQGAVLRMKPDGTDVHVVARGLRGPVGLAFDRRGNLFTNDNDHESRADQYAPSRLLHVIEGIDFGWPRGWMASKSPDRYDLVDSMCDLGRGVPCDLAWYDHGLMSDVIGERLLMCRWDRHNVSAYRLEPHGSTFSAVEEPIIVGEENGRPVGIAADAEGRLYVTALYMTGNMAAPDCVSDLVVIDQADAAAPPKKTETVAAAVSHAPNDFPDLRASADPYYRQMLVGALSARATAHELRLFIANDDEAIRLTGVLAVGRKLTVPDSHFVPPLELELSYPKGSSFFHREQLFYGSENKVDLADLGRIGSFTIAQWWEALEKSGKRTEEQASLFDLLVKGADDSSDRVRLQAVYYLSLLNDARSEPVVTRVRRDVLMKKLSAANEKTVTQAWEIGPFDFVEQALEERPPDLTVAYRGRKWREWDTQQSPAQAAPPVGVIPVTYYSFRVTSRSRQAALVSVGHDGRLWQNETALKGTDNDEVSGQWIVDLQPGSNEFLWRTNLGGVLPRVRAVDGIELARAEKLDSGLLAERLRTASAGTGVAVPAEFAAVDWGRAASQGDAVEGRRLFGALACSKCHAVVPDQKAAGAPSLFEAKRRFTVPHLVESVLLPSRLVAEPFRAQSIVTDDGRTITGLVTSESDAEIEVLQLDAARVRVMKRQIEERSPTTISPMPQGLVKTTDELRHLLAYLLSERPLPP
jgi:putative heme-binding domain-containing protein